ncbi:MAG: IS630 family transposase [Candidatus Edwardsbacteria bacterium]
MDYRPPKSRVICFDEKGTIVIKAYAGRSWSRKAPKIPAKQSIKGKIELLGAYDFHNGKLWVRFFKKKTAKEIILVLEFLRKRYKGYRLYIILDCWRPHRSKLLKEYVSHQSITLVELPTNASWLNPIERIFSEIQNQVLANSNFQSVSETKQSIRKYVRKEYPKIQLC